MSWFKETFPVEFSCKEPYTFLLLSLMNPIEKKEVWLRGPVPGIPPLLQPVAHALLQAQEEVAVIMEDFPSGKLWDKLSGLASPGFHLQHLSGVLDRIFTYARGEQLTEQQLHYLNAEGKAVENTATIADMIALFNLRIDDALDQLWQTDEATLTDFRGVGRTNLPSTVIGLLFHAAEHTQRHVGQLLVTAKVVKSI